MHYIGLDSKAVTEEIAYEMECIAEVLKRKGYTLVTNQDKSNFISGSDGAYKRVKPGDKSEDLLNAQLLVQFINNSYEEELPHITAMSEHSRKSILSSSGLFSYKPEFVIVYLPSRNFATTAKYAFAEADRLGIKVYNIYFQKEFDELQEFLWSKTT